MATHFVRKEIFKQNVNPLCRLCCKEKSIISHIISGCKLLEGTKYIEQHDKICQYLHWCIMQDNNVPVNPNWQWHKTRPVTLITNQLLVTNDMTQEVESVVAANCPDIVILDEKEKKALIIDGMIAIDINMIKAAAGKYKNIKTLR
eukprot:3759182-Ditylum_brightwellii.AAC.1